MKEWNAAFQSFTCCINRTCRNVQSCAGMLQLLMVSAIHGAGECTQSLHTVSSKWQLQRLVTTVIVHAYSTHHLLV